MPSEFVFYYSFYEKQAKYKKLTHIGFLASHNTYSHVSLYILADEIIQAEKSELNHNFEHDYLTRPSAGVYAFGYNPSFMHKYEKSVALGVMLEWQNILKKNIAGLTTSPIYDLKDSDMISDEAVLEGLKYCELAQKLTNDKIEIEKQLKIATKQQKMNPHKKI